MIGYAPGLGDSEDREVRLAAALTLVQLGEAEKAAGQLLALFGGSDSYLRNRARSIIRGANDPRPFVAMLIKEMRLHDRRRRDEALKTLVHIASPKAVRTALDSLFADDDPAIRRWAAERLERILPHP
jgi:HEAT repeat protein